MTDPKNIKIEESHEVRKKRRKKILAEVFDDCVLESVDKVDNDGTVVGEIIKVKKAIYGVQRTICYVEYCVTRGQRFDEMHVPFVSIEPVALDAVSKFQEDGLLRISHDAPEMVVIVHYEKERSVPDEEYKTTVQVSGRVQAIQRQMAKLEKEVCEVQEKD